MIKLTVKQLQEVVDGQLIAITDHDALITAICIDSRQISQGALFVALVGEKFDGHDFVKQSIELGAIVALVNHQMDNLWQDRLLPQIVVKDTHHALGQIATWLRKQSQAKMVALTGSSGKTSVKEMTAAILAQRGKTLATQGNFNNDIGVPLTLFRLTEQDEFAVIELGANHIGEIAYTTAMVKPHSALINNITQAHLEGFGSLAGIAQAKSEIFLGLPKDGIAIINLDSCDSNWFELVKNHQVYTFSLTNTVADFYAKSISQRDISRQDLTQENIIDFILHTPVGEIAIELPLLGLHNVSNALAACALAMSVGANLTEVKCGLQKVQSVQGRLYPIRLNDRQLILDDSYNANIGSMSSAIEVLAQQKGDRVLVVGDMAELGKDSAKYHQQIGEIANLARLDCVVSVGKESALISKFSGVGHHFNSKSEAVLFLLQRLKEKQDITLLVKGSRSAKMEEIIDGIKKESINKKNSINDKNSI